MGIICNKKHLLPKQEWNCFTLFSNQIKNNLRTTEAEIDENLKTYTKVYRISCVWRRVLQNDP